MIYEILIHHDHETIEKIESLFSAYAGILTTTEKTYLFYFLAEYYIRQSDFQKGEGYIQQAYSLLKTGMHPKIFALLQALEATSLCHQGQSGKAFLQITKSLNYFKNTLYFKRIVFIHYITGICLLGMRLFEEAKQHFTNLLPNFPDPDSVMAQSILAHLSWCYLLIQEYEKALTYANMAFEHGADSIELDVCQAFSFFSLKQYEACLAVVERCANEKQKSYLFDFLQLIQYKIEHSEPDFLQTANAVLAQAEKKKNKEIEKMTLGLIVNFYEESHQLDQSHLHLKQLTQLLAA
ncbi:hypothetical protein [uncultured Dubosiella sp.]|uniref:hypothetical protein n=1 Tax=uncultured Dubosiella sp. TaxID=1937011 RepID=UPI0025B50A1D|nr:hypothetical protein [uncultured Dubosiella sp.]